MLLELAVLLADIGAAEHYGEEQVGPVDAVPLEGAVGNAARHIDAAVVGDLVGLPFDLDGGFPPDGVDIVVLVVEAGHVKNQLIRVVDMLPHNGIDRGNFVKP